MRFAIDLFHFLWLLSGAFFLFVAGLFSPKPSRRSVEDAKSIIDWTAHFVAPAADKVIDYMVATRLFEKHFKGGTLLDIGFGAGRFEACVFREAIERGLKADGIDYEVEMESSLAAFKSRSWVAQAWKRSFDETGLPDASYDFLFSNNAIMASRNIGVTLRELARIAKPGGIFQFNLSTRRNCEFTYIFYVALWTILLNKRKADEWRERARTRINGYWNVEEASAALDAAGWEIVEIYPYLSGFYSISSFLFFYPAYQWFWTYESHGGAPFYYSFMKSAWTAWLSKALPMNLEPASTIRQADEAMKFYVVARRKGA
jgi:ubiquinone/menaquinone biosynthesis C-methylase UbiE